MGTNIVISFARMLMKQFQNEQILEDIFSNTSGIYDLSKRSEFSDIEDYLIDLFPDFVDSFSVESASMDRYFEIICMISVNVSLMIEFISISFYIDKYTKNSFNLEIEICNSQNDRKYTFRKFNLKGKNVADVTEISLMKFYDIIKLEHLIRDQLECTITPDCVSIDRADTIRLSPLHDSIWGDAPLIGAAQK